MRATWRAPPGERAPLLQAVCGCSRGAASPPPWSCSYDLLWADPVHGWVDHRFSDHIPNGERGAGGSHAEIFDRSVETTGYRDSVYAQRCARFSGRA